MPSIFTAISLSWQPDTLLQSLIMLGKGMLGIFAVICVIWVFVALLNRFTKNKQA